MTEQYIDVLVQLFASLERVVELAHELLFLEGEFVWVLRIYGREVVAAERIFGFVEHNAAFCIVDGVE